MNPLKKAMMAIMGLGATVLAACSTAPQMGDPQWGQLHLLDGLKPGMRSLRIAKDPACRTCSPGPTTGADRQLTL